MKRELATKEMRVTTIRKKKSEIRGIINPKELTHTLTHTQPLNNKSTKTAKKKKKKTHAMQFTELTENQK